jgi:tRNA (guanine37-N1)-methyltransferase
VREPGGPVVSAEAAPRIAVFTLFPELIEAFAATSLLGRAGERGLVELTVHDLRSHGVGVHRAVDDAPFGGGAGMVLAAAPVFACVETVDPPRPLLVLDPGGRRFDQGVAHELAAQAEGGGFSLLCGRYEGFDQRILDHLVDGGLSIGDVVLAGGEVAAMAVVEAVARLLPGVMGNEASAREESFRDGLLEYPQYTRPAEFRGWSVPAVLRSGDHGRIARWRHAHAILRTARDRPDLLAARGPLTAADRGALVEAGIDAEVDALLREAGAGAGANPAVAASSPPSRSGG